MGTEIHLLCPVGKNITPPSPQNFTFPPFVSSNKYIPLQGGEEAAPTPPEGGGWVGSSLDPSTL